MDPIDPEEIRYIKLGSGGRWTQKAFERGELHFGYRTVSHDLCRRGDWDAVVRSLTEEGRSLSKARDAVREVRDFYALGPDCLWITFADGHLWWAFAAPEVTWLGADENGQGARTRRTVDGWHKVTRIPQIDCDFTDLGRGFRYKNQYLAAFLGARSWRTRWVKRIWPPFGSISTAA